MDVYVSVLIDHKGEVTGKIIQCWGVVQVPSVGKQDDKSDIKKKKSKHRISKRSILSVFIQ